MSNQSKTTIQISEQSKLALKQWQEARASSFIDAKIGSIITNEEHNDCYIMEPQSAT